MYLAKAVSTWDNLSYQTFVTGHNAEMINKWEKSSTSSILNLSDMPTCCHSSFRQSTTTEAQWILSDLKMTKTVLERPATAEMEEILDVRRVSKSFDMRIMDEEVFKLIGLEKDGRPNLSPDKNTTVIDNNKAKTLSFFLVCLAKVDTKLKIQHAGYPLASNIEEIVNYRETFYSKRIGGSGSINIRSKMPRLGCSLRDTFSLQAGTPPSTSTPNTSRAPTFTFGNETDHSYAINSDAVIMDYNLNQDASISDSQLCLTASAIPEEDPEQEDEAKKGEIAQPT